MSDSGFAERNERLVAWLGPALSPLVVGFAALQAFHYQRPDAGWLLLGGAVLFVLSPVAHRRGFSALQWVNLVFSGCVVGVALLRGGVIPPLLVWLIVPPTGSMIVGRGKAALAWLAVLPFEVLAIHLVERTGVLPPKVESTMTGFVIGVAGALLALTVLLFIQERGRRRAMLEHGRMQEALFRGHKLESIARLAGGVAHDFNNLLSVVASHAKVIEGLLPDDHDARQDVHAILKAADSGAGMTRRLLAVGRERPETRAPIDLREVGREVAGLLHKLLPDEVELVSDIATEPVVVEADRWQLQQVLLNLAINARDAMPNGGRLSLTIARRESIAVVEVEDEGVGMTPEVVDRIFEPFFTTRSDGGGTGLGLAVVHGVATALDGDVEVESAPGRGTTIRVLLPTTERPAVSLAVTEMPADVGATRILLVEDDPTVRRATRRLLELDDHDVTTAANGDEAIAIAGERSVDVLLTDVSMPGMSGPELARRLRESHDMGVIFFSGFPGESLEQDDLAAERVQFLQKPASREALQRAIRDVRPDCVIPP